MTKRHTTCAETAPPLVWPLSISRQLPQLDTLRTRVLGDHVVEINKQRVGIIWSGCGFGVILHREHRLVLETQALDSVVVQIHFGDDRAGFFQFLAGGGKSVVLRRDRDFAGFEVLDRLIAAAVAELQLEGLGAERVGNNLVTQANAEGRVLLDQLLDRRVGVIDRSRITGAVGQEHAIRIEGLDLVRRCAGGEHVHVKTVVLQFAVDRELGTEVQRSDFVALDRRGIAEQIGTGHSEGLRLQALGVPLISLRGGHFFDEVDAYQTTECLISAIE